MKFSIVVPVYNRPREVAELLGSLRKQRYPQFEVIIVEDGSTLKCESLVNDYKQHFEIAYFYKPNTGPGDSRNFGATKADGDYLVFFDSDCIIPANYLELVAKHLHHHPLDVYGGPDKTPDDLNNLQQAINYSMTSFLTTGGIRGHRRSAANFRPRSFNMGVKREIFLKSGGFTNMHPGEDPELVYRLENMEYSRGLIADAFVYHKRRINLNQFSKQVYKFGLARAILMKWHPASKKWIFALPTLVSTAGFLLFVLGIKYPLLWLVLLLGVLIIFADALRKTKRFLVSLMCIPTTLVQIICYGWGFLNGWWNLSVMGRSEVSRFPAMFKQGGEENP